MDSKDDPWNHVHLNKSLFPSGYQIRGEAIVDQLPVPPDGGYGWVIVGAAFVCNFIV
jgi:hypothetical protein